jgi:hypothetical protein
MSANRLSMTGSTSDKAMRAHAFIASRSPTKALIDAHAPYGTFSPDGAGLRW